MVAVVVLVDVIVSAAVVVVVFAAVWFRLCAFCVFVFVVAFR